MNHNQTTTLAGACETFAPSERCPQEQQIGFELGFTSQPDGVYFQSATGKAPFKISTPIYVESRTQSQNGIWGVSIQIKNYDHVKVPLYLENAQIKNSAEFGKILANAGVTTYVKESIPILQKYLLESQIEARTWIVSKTGWTANRESFVLKHRTIGDQKFRHKDHHSVSDDYQRGTHLEWSDEIAKPQKGNPFLMLATSTALAGPLLNPLKCGSYMFHYYCNSSRGKTISMMLAATVWCGPQTMGSWHGTRNGLEARFSERNGMCEILDEGGMAPDSLQEIAYMLGNEREKQRANIDGRSNPSQSHSLTALSTGEKSIADFVSKRTGDQMAAGAQSRIISMSVDGGLFQNLHGFATPAEFADALKERSSKYYGTASIAFIENLLARYASSWDVPKHLWTDMTKLLLDEQSLSNVDGQIQRVASYFAMSALAGELGIEFGVLPWTRGEVTSAVSECFGHWLNQRGTKGSIENQQILSQIRRLIEENGTSCFQYLQINPHNSSEKERVPNKMFGYRKGTTDGSTVWLILPQMFKEVFCVGFGERQVVHLLKSVGWLNCDSEGNPTRQHRIPGFNKALRLFELNDRVLEGGTGD